MTTAIIATQRRVLARSLGRPPSSSNAIAAPNRHPPAESYISRFQAGAAVPSDMEPSLLLDAGVTDDAAPFADFGPQSRGKLVRRRRQRLKAEFRVTLDQFGIGQGFAHLPVERADHLRRGTGRSEGAVPAHDIEARHARLVHSGDVWRIGRPLRRG